MSPLDGAVDVSVSPVLESSSFSDPEGHHHDASQWQITDRTGKYENPYYDSGEDTSNLRYIAIPSDTLKNGETYYWRVRYRDNHNGWSEWSRHVLSELERLNKCYESLDKKLNNVAIEIAMLKVKSGIWGLVAGAIPVAIMIIVPIPSL